MKYKMTAVLVALAMMFAGVFVMANGDGTDADATVPSVTLIAGASEATKTVLMLNDNAYDYNNATKVTTWKVSDSTTTVTVTDSSTEKVNDILFNISGEGAKYTLSMKATGSTAAEEKTYTITASVVLTFTATTGTYSLALEDVTYQIKITVSGTAPTSASDLSFVKGASVKQAITVTGLTGNMSDYDWYATGLPAGLGMAKDGTIAGFVNGEVEDYTCTVTASKKVTTTETPVMYSGIALKIAITAPTTADVKLTFTGAKVVDSLSGSTEMIFSGIGTTTAVSPSGTAVVKQDETASFTMTGITGKVYSINDAGSIAEITDSSGYKLDTSGTGTYRIMICGTVGGYENVTLTFVLTVVATAQGDWAPAIIINGN